MTQPAVWSTLRFTEPKITDRTNQVGQPRVLSRCRSRNGTMFNSSTRLTMARGTWIGTKQNGCNLDTTVKYIEVACLYKQSKVQENLKNILHYGVCPELGGYAQLHFWVRKKPMENMDITSEHDTEQTWTNLCMELLLRHKK